MYKKSSQGMVAQQFALADPDIAVGSLVCMSGSMEVSDTGTYVIGELIAKTPDGTMGTVELKHAKLMTVTAGAGGLTAGGRCKLSAANTAIADAAGDLIALSTATATNPATVTFF